MNPNSLPEIHSEELEQVIRAVFETMVGTDTLEEPVESPACDRELTATVHLTGYVQGEVVVSCMASQACVFAGRYLNKKPPSAVDSEVLDVLGEIANMIAGNLKRAALPGAHLSMPMVHEGVDPSPLPAHTGRREVFQTEHGPLSVTVAFSPSERPH